MAKGNKTSELRGKGDAEIAELIKTAKNDLFKARFENYTNRLNDTASVRRLRRDIARLNTVLSERSRSAKKAATAKAEG